MLVVKEISTLPFTNNFGGSFDGNHNSGTGGSHGRGSNSPAINTDNIDGTSRTIADITDDLTVTGDDGGIHLVGINRAEASDGTLAVANSVDNDNDGFSGGGSSPMHNDADDDVEITRVLETGIFTGLST